MSDLPSHSGLFKSKRVSCDITYRYTMLHESDYEEEEEDNVSFIWLAKSLNIKDCLFMVSSTWEMHLPSFRLTEYSELRTGFGLDTFG